MQEGMEFGFDFAMGSIGSIYMAYGHRTRGLTWRYGKA